MLRHRRSESRHGAKMNGIFIASTFLERRAGRKRHLRDHGRADLPLVGGRADLSLESVTEWGEHQQSGGSIILMARATAAGRNCSQVTSGSITLLPRRKF